MLAIMLLPGIGVSQTNPHSQYKDLIGSSFNSAFINSAATPKVIGYPESGNFDIQANPQSSNSYRYTYEPLISEGNTKAVVEYYQISNETGMLVPEYTTIYFRITRSIINCGDDRKTIEVNSSVSGIDVLENDTRSDGPLELVSILYSEGGVASIVNGEIDFVPFLDFTGDAFVYYSVVDTVGKSGTGALKVKVIDPATIELEGNLRATSYGGEKVELDLPYEGFVLETTLTHGEFENIGGVQVYSPFYNGNGIENFVLRKGNLVRNVRIELIERPRSNSWVVNDVRYTSKGVPVSIDVTENDYLQNQVIISTSSELEQPAGAANGHYIYTPPSYYVGSKKMEYTVFNGYDTETGMVTVHVNNFTPLTKVDYNFTTVANSALVIDYNIPISNYSFEMINAPTNGQLIINPGSSSIDLGCEEITGENLIIYEPSYNYQGTDEFRVRYCVDGKCKNVTIEVNVIENDLEDCACFTGCVWAGDANNDGVVNAGDLISMAYAIGTRGAETEWNGSSGWIGRNTNDWSNDIHSQVNPKFSDADGNGVVDEFDLDEIFENYNENHALVPPQVLNNKSYPFTIRAITDTVYVGDLIQFEIGIGNKFYPAVDVNGLVYSLGFPPSIVDSSSMVLDYPSDTWFGIDEKVVGLTKQIRDGWIETAVSRLGVKPKSGAGHLGTLSFIVEEDVVGGFRVANDGIIPLTVTISEGKVMSDDGVMYEVPGSEYTVYINLNKRQEVVEKMDLIIYPNPSSNETNIHMNGGEAIISYQIYNMSGQLIDQKQNVNAKSDRITLSNFLQGIYVIKATTNSGVKVAKFEVTR